MFTYVAKKVLGTSNQRSLKKLRPLVVRVNELETDTPTTWEQRPSSR